MLKQWSMSRLYDFCHFEPPCSFRGLASEGFPSGYSKRVCVSACTQKLRIYDFLPSNDGCRTPPRHYRLAECQLSSPCPPSQNFSSFGAASCLVEHILITFCVLHQCQSCRNYNVHLCVLLISKGTLYLRPDWYRFGVRAFLHASPKGALVITDKRPNCTTNCWPLAHFSAAPSPHRLLLSGRSSLDFSPLPPFIPPSTLPLLFSFLASSRDVNFCHADDMKNHRRNYFHSIKAYRGSHGWEPIVVPR